MDGAELTTEEFAFLLASLGATSVIDLDDPELFPKTVKKQQKVFEQGLEQLVEHGWVETESEDPAEAGLNATLFQLVAVVSAPEIVISTSIRSTADGPLRLLHYVGGDWIVELNAPAESRYQLGVVADLPQLASRLSQFLGVADSGNGAMFALRRDQASKLRGMAVDGKTDAAGAGFADAGLPEDQAAILARALAKGPVADVVGARVIGVEVERTARATVFGEGGSSWLIFYTDADAAELTLAAASGGNIQAMLAAWIGEFGLEFQSA